MSGNHLGKIAREFALVITLIPEGYFFCFGLGIRVAMCNRGVQDGMDRPKDASQRN
jgi:hypothetical protein